MKKLLALVLALVMTLSLCTISNAAYSDQSDVDYDEAVAVMSLVGVFQGADGKFSPKANLTREQAAKLIAYLDLGESVAEALPAVKVFNDVEANRWSAKYIAYCADAGYLAGVGNGNFDPAGELTGYAFGKMLLCVLGYKADEEGFTGSAWQIAVAKLMESEKLAKSVSGSPAATLTREAAAQYCFNTIKLDTITYSGNGTVIGYDEDNRITSISSAVAGVASKTGKTLMAKLYGDKLTVKENAPDDLGRIGNKWSYQASKSAKAVSTDVFAAEADFTLTIAKSYKNLKDTIDGINKELGFTKAADKIEVNEHTEIVVNGKPFMAPKAKFMETKGVDVELYVTTEKGVKHADTVLLICKELVKIYDVKDLTASELKAIAKKVDKGDIEADSDEALATKKVYLSKEDWRYDTKFAGFNYAKNDYVLVTVNADKKIVASEAAKTVSGKITAIKGVDQVAVDGTYYTVAGIDLPEIAAEGKWALDAAGKLAGVVDVTTKSSDYAYVYNVIDADAVADEDGVKGKNDKVYMILADGTKASYIVDEDSDPITMGSVIAYVINKDGYIENATPSETIMNEAAEAKVSKSDAGVVEGIYANGDTKFVFVKNTEKGATKKVAAEVVTGYKNVVINQDVIAVYKDSVAKLVFVIGTNGAAESDVTYAVMVDSTQEYTKDADKNESFTVKIAVDGEEKTLTVSKKTVGELNGIEDGVVFSYTMTGSDIDVTPLKYEAAEVTVAEKDYFVVADKQYALSDTDIYTVTTDDDGVTVAVADEIAKGDMVYVAKTDDSVKTAKIVFVFVDETTKD